MYEVVFEGYDSVDIVLLSEYEIFRIVKVSYYRYCYCLWLYLMGCDLERFIGYYRFGFYIIFLDGDDNDDRLLINKDRRLYGFIGLFIFMFVRIRG